MLLINRLIVIVSLLAFLSMAQADDPAVSNINGKFEALAGVLDDDGTGIAGASMALPLGHYLGLQLDAAGGSTDSDGVFGYGTHLFLRSPDVGLLGALLTRTGRSGDYVNRYGFEGEYYGEQWTLAANGGKQTGFIGSTWHATSMPDIISMMTWWLMRVHLVSVMNACFILVWNGVHSTFILSPDFPCLPMWRRALKITIISLLAYGFILVCMAGHLNNNTVKMIPSTA